MLCFYIHCNTCVSVWLAVYAYIQCSWFFCKSRCSGSSEKGLVFLGEVAADASDHRRDELGQTAELPAEEGVIVLGLRGHGLEVVDGSPGHAHRVDDDVWQPHVTKTLEINSAALLQVRVGGVASPHDTQ